MTVLTTIRPTTTLEAVNIVLGAIGEAPLPLATNLVTIVLTDLNAEIAVSILREAARDVLTYGWRFNTTIGARIAPTTSYVSTVDSVATTLNLFVAADTFLSWTQTLCAQNAGLDLIPAMIDTTPLGAANALFDRVRNRYGAPLARYPFIYLDVTTAVDFTLLPEEARRLITIMAARRMAQRVPASDIQAAFTQQDERQAMRVLQRSHGIRKPGLNLFNTHDAHNIAGGRPQFGGGLFRRVF